MKQLNLLKIILSIILVFAFTSCYHINTKVEVLPYNHKDVEVSAKKVIENINFTKISTIDSVETFKTDNNVMFYKYIIQATEPDTTKITVMSGSQYSSVSDNMNKSFRSFLLQELNPKLIEEYPDKFYKLPQKTKTELKRKFCIHPSVGIHYLGKENPYADKSDYMVGKIFFAIWDAFSYYMIIGGPFFGEKTEDKIGIPLLGIANMVLWRYMTYKDQGKRDFENYNRFSNSGYMVPVDVKQ